MSKGPNSRPDKGFVKELSRRGGVKKVEHKVFDYSKPLTPQTKKTDAMSTPHRIKNFRKVKAGDETLVSETKNHIKKRRGE